MTMSPEDQVAIKKYLEIAANETDKRKIAYIEAIIRCIEKKKRG